MTRTKQNYVVWKAGAGKALDEGHGFSRAVQLDLTRALAPEVRFFRRFRWGQLIRNPERAFYSYG
jgi:hypothetical protein